MNATWRSEPSSEAARRAVVQIEPDWFGKLSGITLLFKALVLGMAQLMIFAAVARLVNESWHRAHAICSRYVDPAVTEADLSRVVAVAIDEIRALEREQNRKMENWRTEMENRDQ